jgi:polysaccharide pyruvyl transferase WcaK-like protein
MKVGILSMQQISNFGSFLQAYALKRQIENLGHSCYFIKIKNGKQLPGLKRNFKFYFNKINDRFVAFDFIKRLNNEYSYRKIFKEFHRELYGDTSELLEYDVVVIGSDEVFNCTQYAWWGFTTQLFGDIPNANKVISYAGSFGHTTIEKLEYFKIKETVKQSMKNFSAVSVRDENSFKIVNNLLIINPHINVDPVLTYNFDDEISTTVDEENFIIIYTYPGRINSKKEINAIKSFAKSKNKKLISLGFYFKWCDKTIIPHPFEVLAYFKKADYIITDTFHGSVMSLKFNKQFCTIVRDSNKQKLSSLLHQFDLEDQIVECTNTIPEKLSNRINYENINNIIKEEQSKSINYLKNNIL